MAYSKNDPGFRSFVAGRVLDCGDHWEIHSQTGRHVMVCPKAYGAIEPKAGWRYRVYDQGGNERGCYIGGRKLFYRTPLEQRTWTREVFAITGLRVAARTPNKTKRQAIK